MANKHELEIEINARGQVEVRVKGAKGKKCLDYVHIFNTVGKVSDQQLTSEFYEPEPSVIITDQTQTHTKL
ncbi:MAG: DUF2997 domain-containing protein [Armatimonadetes bacterium]|nr:DUF2997 domain-containing protein [Armatimonadota bacterium]